MADSANELRFDFDAILISNGFQAEYEIGFTNGLSRCGVKPLLVCSENMLVGRLDQGVKTLNLRGSQRSDRSAVQKAMNIIRYWVQLWRLLSSHRSLPVHVIGLFTLRSTWSALFEASVLRHVSKHFVLTVHNVLPHNAHSFLNRQLYRLIYKLPHKLVVHTGRMAEALQTQFGVPLSKLVVMEHGIDRLAPAPLVRSQWLAHHLDLPVGCKAVLFFGNVSHYKGLDILVAALVDAPNALDAVLVVAGACIDREFRAKISPGLNYLVEQGRARWVDGFVPEERVLEYFHGSDVLVMPYRAIDQSGVVFMALATGLPVVATDVGSLAEYVPLTGGKVVEPGNTDALLAGLQDVLASSRPEKRPVRVNEASRFLWSHTVIPLLAAYGRQP